MLLIAYFVASLIAWLCAAHEIWLTLAMRHDVSTWDAVSPSMQWFAFAWGVIYVVSRAQIWWLARSFKARFGLCAPQSPEVRHVNEEQMASAAKWLVSSSAESVGQFVGAVADVISYEMKLARIRSSLTPEQAQDFDKIHFARQRIVGLKGFVITCALTYGTLAVFNFLAEAVR